MIESEWIGAISVLVGTIGGAAVTLVIQARTDRSAHVAREAARLAALRSGLQLAATQFLGAAQAMERVATADAQLSEKEHATQHLWAAYKSLLLICPPQVREPLRTYADALHGQMWNRGPSDRPVWEKVTGPGSDFTEAVRRAMGADDEWP